MKLIPLLSALCVTTLPLFAEDPKAPPAGAQNLSVDAAETLLKEHPKIIIIDVRTPVEFQAGHIPGARNLDFQEADFVDKVAALDPKETYLVHCAAGGRSTQAVEVMNGRKVAAMYHLKDGFKAWEKAGKLVEK